MNKASCLSLLSNAVLISAREAEKREIRRYQAQALDEELNSVLPIVLPHGKLRATIRA